MDNFKNKLIAVIATLLSTTSINALASPIYFSHTELTNYTGENIGDSMNYNSSIASIDGNFQEKTLIRELVLGDMAVSSAYSYSAKAQSSEDGLRAYVSASQWYEITLDTTGALDILDLGALSYGLSAYSSFRDTLAVTGADDLSSVEFDLHIHGSMSFPDGRGGEAWVSAPGTGIYLNSNAYPSGSEFNLTITGVMDVIDGFATIEYGLYAATGFFPFFDYNPNTDTPYLTESVDHWNSIAGGESVFDFFNTVTIGQFRGLNDAREFVDLTSITGTDGKIYDVYHIASPVPEPVTYFMLLIGLGLIYFTNYFRQSGAYRA